MKIVQRYKAHDGRIFDSEKECIDYEKLSEDISNIMKDLKPLPKDDSCRFSNGEGYIQQDKYTVTKAKKDITDSGNKFFKTGNDKWSFEAIGRLFDDSAYRNFYYAWGRLQCIDKLSREWGQPYYAINMNAGTQKEFTN